ncbi:DUF535 family protein [Paraburkholderia kururiensis]|uniref:DUF535 family protein n=1 Tax=Paraburkholderia kururiensis TaxID=984307 RepID=UPI000693A624|nr:DUF535 family protein [Paraburkholderia kururiensis]
MLVAHALRFLPEFVPGRDLKSRFRRARIWMYAALHPRAACCWFNALAEHRVLADIARHDRRFAERPFHGLAQLRLGALERVAMIRDHHVLMERLLGDALTRRVYLMGEHVVLAACPQFEIVLKTVTRCRREGLLTVACTDTATGVDLAWATLTLEMRPDTRTPGLFIGGLQGPGGEHREQVRVATRASHGLRPKAAVMEAIGALCELLDIRSLTAVARSAHVSSAGADAFRSDYDAFWQELGGTRAGERFALPLVPPHRTIDQVPSNKRAAFRRRQMLIAQMKDELRHSVERARHEATPRSDPPARKETAPALAYAVQ